MEIPEPSAEASPRLLVMTMHGVEHRYFASVIAAAFPAALRAIVVAEPLAQSLGQKVAGYARRYSAVQLASRAATRTYQRLIKYRERRDAALAEVLFSNRVPPRHVREDLLRTVPSHNGPQMLALLDEIQPDIVCVYGTRMIRRPVIQCVSGSVLNLHTGISPTYRGSDSVFWAIHNRQPEFIGATVHQLDEGIDSGAILATARPKIDRTDNEHTLFAKCVKCGTERFVECIQAFASGTVQPMPQDLDSGRCYRFVDRTLRAELRVARLIREGLLARYAQGSR